MGFFFLESSISRFICQRITKQLFFFKEKRTVKFYLHISTSLHVSTHNAAGVRICVIVFLFLSLFFIVFLLNCFDVRGWLSLIDDTLCFRVFGCFFFSQQATSLFGNKNKFLDHYSLAVIVPLLLVILSFAFESPVWHRVPEYQCFLSWR